MQRDVALHFHICHLGLAFLRHMYSYVTLLKSHKGLYRVVIEYFPIISFLVLYRQPGAVLTLLEAIGGQRAFLGSIYALTIRYLKSILAEKANGRENGFEPDERKTVFWE